MNVQTLRYYERRGLLPEPERLESGYRSYGSEAVRIVRFVKRAQQLGFSLDDVGSLLQLAGGGPESCGAARRLAAEKMAELDRKIEALGAMRESLSQLVATCDRPPASRECPLLQALDDEAHEGERLAAGEGGAEAGFIVPFDGFELLPHVVALLVEGRPIRPRDVADAVDLPVEQVEAFLRSQPGTDWDDEGRIIGFGLTLRPTPHRFLLDGRPLYTWCATDTLFFPAVLSQSALVESSCQATGVPIRLEVAPDRVVSVHPPTTVVSQVHPGDTVDDLRGMVCRHGHFFSSPEAAAIWASGHPEGVVLSVIDAFERARVAGEDLGWVARSAQTDQAGRSLRRPPMSEEARC